MKPMTKEETATHNEEMIASYMRVATGQAADWQQIATCLKMIVHRENAQTVLAQHGLISAFNELVEGAAPSAEFPTIAELWLSFFDGAQADHRQQNLLLNVLSDFSKGREPAADVLDDWETGTTLFAFSDASALQFSGHDVELLEDIDS